VFTTLCWHNTTLYIRVFMLLPCYSITILYCKFCYITISTQLCDTVLSLYNSGLQYCNLTTHLEHDCVNATLCYHGYSCLKPRTMVAMTTMWVVFIGCWGRPVTVQESTTNRPLCWSLTLWGRTYWWPPVQWWRKVCCLITLVLAFNSTVSWSLAWSPVSLV